MTLAVEKDEPFNPLDIRLLRSDRVVLQPDHSTDLIEQFRLVRKGLRC